MLQLQKIKLEGFRSFQKEQELDISSLPVGLHYITGKNLVNKRLGSNGSGKSTIPESLTFALKGKLSSNLRGKHVYNWETKKGKVEIDFMYEDKPYTLIRRFPDNVFNSNVKELSSQEELDKFIELSFDAFLHSVYIDQNSSKFINMQPSERLEIFTSILGENLEKLDRCSEECLNRLKKIEGDVSEKTTTLAKYIETEKVLKAIRYIEDIKKWEEKKVEKVEKYRDNILKINVDIAKKNDIIYNILLKLKQKDDELNTLTFNVKDIRSIDALIEKLQKIISENKALLQHSEKQIEKFKAVVGVCPTCLQQVNPNIIQHHIDELVVAINSYKTIITTAQSEVEVEKKNKEEYNKLKQTIDKLNIDVTTLKHEATTVDRDLQQLQVDKSRAEEEIKSIENEVNPFVEKEQSRKIQVSALAETILKVEKELGDIKNLLDIYSFWKKGFALIKLDIVEDALKELEFSACKILSMFKMENWEIKFETSVETKQGTQKKGLQILIKSDKSKEFVPFETWSGGEKQRLSIAVVLAVSTFIRDRSRKAWNVIFFDEPSQWLSKEGIEDCIEICTRYCVENNLIGFLLDQRTLNDYNFASIIDVIKTEEGSIIKKI